LPKQTKSKPEPPPFKGFIEYDLTEEEKSHLKAQPFELVDANVQMTNLVQAEYRVSFGFDFYNSTFTCSLSHKDPKHGNAGWVLVGRGSEPIKALKQVLYKHYQVFDEVWSNARAMSRAELDD
jgi:hypothetical protein